MTDETSADRPPDRVVIVDGEMVDGPDDLLAPEDRREPHPGLRRRGDDPEQAFPVGGGRLALESGLTALVTWVWFAVLYRAGEITWHIPIYQDRSDARLISNLIQNTVRTGWFETTPGAGAPWGQEMYDFPHGGETSQLVLIKFLSLFTDEYGLIINLYFVIGFAVTAVVTHLVLRHLRFSFPVSFVGGVLYVFLPFHFYHEQSHTFRSSYWYAPLACLILVWALQWRERFLSDPEARLAFGNLRWKRVAFVVAACMLLASTETMTTSFTMTLLAVTGIIGAIRHREPSRLLVNGALILVLAVTFLTLLYPTLNYVRAHGNNELAARRQVTEQERYGLKISRMVLPSGDHRFSKMRRIGNKAQEDTPILSEGGQALTVLGTAGFFGALFWLIFNGWGRLPGRRPGEDPPRWDTRAPTDRRALLDNGGLVILCATLIGTVAGLAMVLSVMGFSQVHVWNRIVLIIAFFALAFTGHWFERVGEWIKGRVTSPKPILALLTVAVLAFGLWDGGRPAGRDYPAMKADFESDRAFVRQIERTVPEGTNVFQLPVVPFPEQPPPGQMLDYDLLRPYLHSDGTTRWSYGKVKGRPLADWQWQQVRDTLGPIEAMPALLGLGYTGLWVDTFGYPDGGEEIRAQLTELLGVEPMVSPNGRHLYYDLVPYKQSLGLSEAELQQLARDQLGVEPPAAEG